VVPELTGVLLLLALLLLLEVVHFALGRMARRKESRRAGRALVLAPGARVLAPPAARRGDTAARPVLVLVHGFAGFDELRALGRRAAYFRGVRERIEARGVMCVVPRLPPVAAIAVRARALAQQLDEIAAKGHTLHVLAHSMGGLDARYAISAYGAKGVQSLVTIATPHLGTPLAKGLARVACSSGLSELARAMDDLVSTRLEAISSAMRVAEGIRCACVIAAPRPGRVHPLLRPTHAMLTRRAGANDGLVPVSSQAWGDVLGEVDTDHWGIIGWGSGFDAASFYDALVASLPGLGAVTNAPRLSAA
jgi:triacylglycerol lipase